jgi:hypothetical protein
LYLASWTIGYLIVVGQDRSLYWTYLRLFWGGGGGEPVFFAGMFSMVIFLVMTPLVLFAISRACASGVPPRQS